MSDNTEIVYKILLLGDTTVGKTCFLMRYTDNTFQEVHMSTIGLDYRVKNMQLNTGKIVKVQIWDTAGQDRFRAITKNYYKGANGIILIYDITNQQTFENVKNWITQIKEEANENVCIFLIGNKIDDEENRTVTTEEGKELAKEFSLPFYETSAKTGVNIDSTFSDLINKVDQVYSSLDTHPGGNKISKKTKNNRNCCH